MSGEWLVRIEDIDPPREQAGASTAILKTLEAYGLHWDREVLFQSQRLNVYGDVLHELRQQGLAYPCTCTRKELADWLPGYSGLCRQRTDIPTSSHAIRFNARDQKISFTDRIQGLQRFDLTNNDFVVFRKDGLFAYQLAVTVDDAFQGVTHIVRGIDLIDSTPRQIALQQALGYTTPSYAHLPVITNGDGDKLSKQNRADPIPLANPHLVLLQAMQALALPVNKELKDASLAELLLWAQQHWTVTPLRNKQSIAQSTLHSNVF